MRYIHAIIVLTLLLLLMSCKGQENIPRESGELTAKDTLDAIAKQSALEEEMLRDSTWVDPGLKTGKTPEGLSFTPQKDRNMNNYLEISVGDNTDVVVKLVSRKTDKCIRYVYVKGNDTYPITNIPQGLYYLKIGYGKNWRQKEIDGKIVGKFLSNAQYEIGTETLDYNISYGSTEYTDEGSYQNYSIPSYSVSLNVVQFATLNSFETDTISESEFNE
jgi:hypothetical protein